MAHKIFYMQFEWYQGINVLQEYFFQAHSFRSFRGHRVITSYHVANVKIRLLRPEGTYVNRPERLG